MKKTYKELQNSVNFYRALATLFLIIIVVLAIAVDTEENKIVQLEDNVSKCAGYEVSEQKFQNTVKVLRIKSERVEELEAANEALVSVCKPSVFHEVARKTPLPKMKEA